MKAYLLLLSLCLTTFSFAVRSKTDIWVDDMLHRMTLNEKIGQLFMVAAYSNKDSDYENQLEKTINDYNIGGIIFFQGDPTRQLELTNRYQKNAKYPLLIGIDAEHGLGWRLQNAMEFPRMLIEGAISNDSLIYQLGAAIARHCKELGVHVNFAPVVDINNNPLNPVIGMRSFGEDRENVYRKAAMYIQGSLSENILPVAKHFPGHGDTDSDSHQTLPLIRHKIDRLDSIELYPFKKLIDSHLPAIMIAHLDVPALDTTHIPASLSPRIIKNYLRQKLNFDGLCFTDAMNMKGVTRNLEPGEAEVQALLAGNDILLFPADINKAVRQIKRALSQGIIQEEDINNKCRKILITKYKYVLPNLKPLTSQGLWSKINTPQDFALKQTLYKNAITLIENKQDLLPLKALDTLRIACINFGDKKINVFQTMLEKYAPIHQINLDNNLSDEEIIQTQKAVSKYNCIILYNSNTSERTARNFGYSAQFKKLIKQLSGKKLIFCHPGIPYGLTSYMDLSPDAILVSYENQLYAQQYAAQAIFGGIPISGKLPVSINSKYPVGKGIITAQTRLGYTTPENCHVSSAILQEIDTMCEYAIKQGAAPGCQVLVAKNNYIIYNKAFGHNTYDKKTANHTSNIYDLASVSKITATLPAIMQLYDTQKIALDTSLSSYYPALKETNKNNITLKEVLAHNAGLKAYIPSFADAVNKKALTGHLFTTVPTKYNKLKLKDRLYINPNFTFRDSTLSNSLQTDFKLLEPGIYIYKDYRDSIMHAILYSDLTPKKEYLYSDLGFILLQQIAESVTHQPLDLFCRQYFFHKLGAYNTDFQAYEYLNTSRIIPSSIDHLYRKAEIKGYVHDPTAAIMGGIAGHAGLFSTAEDLAKIMALYLNKGTYGGERYFSPATVNTFTTTTNLFPHNRRSLGFDKPEPDTTKPSPACKAAPLNSFGHTGFTGTMAWCDPDNQLIYIFLSNRTYPNEFNNKLSELNIRTRIQEIIYRSILSETFSQHIVQ